MNGALKGKYELSLDRFFRDFTIMTYGAAVMARVVNAFVSREIHASDENWMSCMAYRLNHAMKSVMSTHCSGTILEEVAQDFWSMKKIIEDRNRSGWNHLLPRGYKLLQDYETRFGTYFQVSTRYLKVAHTLLTYLTLI